MNIYQELKSYLKKKRKEKSHVLWDNNEYEHISSMEKEAMLPSLVDGRGCGN